MNGEIKFTFHPASPIVSEESNEDFADVLLDILRVVSGSDEELVSTKKKINSSSGDNKDPLIPKNSLVLAAAAIGSLAVLSHAGGYAQFFNSLQEMKANVADPADFNAALNFWIFFAVGHPILQPILWISDVLHGSPGPMIGDLVPATFILGNIVAIAAITYIAEIRNAVNVAAIFAFFAYVGAGLDGQAGLGDFNLALDDSYKGQIVKGCPAYEEVRQPSMNDFNLEKYQGLWYEQKFHDWTQFKEVYDTTLDIKVRAVAYRLLFRKITRFHNLLTIFVFFNFSLLRVARDGSMISASRGPLRILLPSRGTKALSPTEPTISCSGEWIRMTPREFFAKKVLEWNSRTTL